MVGKKFRLGALVAGLEHALAYWDSRDTRTPGPGAEVRRAASTAVDAIDEMLTELHALRSRLVSETRRSDDAFMDYLDRKYGPVGDVPATEREVA